MLKISKLTDYGIGLMTCLARKGGTEPVTARRLSAEMGLPLPTVSKVLKLLSGGSLLVSTRGATGGYRLARTADQISLAEMFEALEGPVAVTACSSSDGCDCELEAACGLRPNWNWINRQLLHTLENINLQHMTGSIARDLKHFPVPSVTDQGAAV